MTLEDTMARDQARSAAIEQLAEMGGRILVVDGEASILPAFPPDWDDLPMDAAVGWSCCSTRAPAGDPDALVGAIRETYDDYQRWKARWNRK